MQVRSGTASTVAHPTDGMSRVDPRARHDCHLRKMTVAGSVARDVLNHDASAMAAAPASLNHVSGGRALNNSSIFSRHINAIMESLPFFERIGSGTVEAGNARGGQGPIQTDRGRFEIALGMKADPLRGYPIFFCRFLGFLRADSYHLRIFVARCLL